MNTSIRTAVLLVAGTGSRLRPLTDSVPKALLPVGSETILIRLIRQLRECGITRFVLATGYCEEAVREALLQQGVAAEYCRNENFSTTQNSVSLLNCAATLCAEPFIKLDGDLVLDVEILKRVLSEPSEMVVAVDSSRHLDQESMKTQIDGNGLVLDFGKSLPLSKSHAESIGVEKLDRNSGQVVLSRIAELVSQGITDRYYEDVYAELIQSVKLTAKTVDIRGLSWTEVDTLEDLELARQLVEQLPMNSPG